MKKILSVVLVLAMVLALGVTAFADEVVYGQATGNLQAGKTYPYAFTVADASKGVTLKDSNGILVFGEPVVNGNDIHVNVTAPAGTEGKVTKILVMSADTNVKTPLAEAYVSVAAPAAPEAPKADAVAKLADLTIVAPVETNIATITMPAGVDGIDAAAYNALKTANYEKIVIVDAEGEYTWTLTRGDYTKMNVTAAIYFGVEVDVNLWTLDKDKNVVKDTATENAVLKALGNTKADVFYVTINDNVNIANVASKPELVVSVENTWITFNNKFSVTAYKFDGETVAKVAEGLAVKPATGKLALNLAGAGTYVFVADNYTVNPTAPSDTQKPNAGTGANSAAAVVAIAVMAVAAVASKKIVK